MEDRDTPSARRPTTSDNAVEREAQIDEIIERLERLELEAARLRELAARLKERNDVRSE